MTEPFRYATHARVGPRRQVRTANKVSAILAGSIDISRLGIEHSRSDDRIPDGCRAVGQLHTANRKILIRLCYTSPAGRSVHIVGVRPDLQCLDQQATCRCIIVPLPLDFDRLPGIEAIEQGSPNRVRKRATQSLSSHLGDRHRKYWIRRSAQQEDRFEQRGFSRVVASNDQVDAAQVAHFERLDCTKTSKGQRSIHNHQSSQ
jgi:hypothetical protein